MRQSLESNRLSAGPGLVTSGAGVSGSGAGVIGGTTGKAGCGVTSCAWLGITPGLGAGLTWE